MKTRILLSLLFCGILIACDGPQGENPLEESTPPSQPMEDEDIDGTAEKIVEQYEDGQKKTVIVYAEDGTSRLEERRYFPTGELQIEGEYLNDKRHGKWIAWYQDGTKWSENNYKEGEYHGPYNQWYDNGQKRVAGQYAEGEKVGTWLFYDREGEIVTTEEYN